MADKPQKSPETENAPRRADEESGAEQPHRKETFPNEALEGQPGYGEAPPEARKDKLPEQDWK